MEEKQKVELTLPNPLNIAVQVPGLPGKDGKSAYEVAVERGFVGTVDEWLESLHGQNGSSSEPVSLNFPTVVIRRTLPNLNSLTARRLQSATRSYMSKDSPDFTLSIRTEIVR